MEAKIVPRFSTTNPRPQREHVQRTMTDPQGNQGSNRRSSLGCNYILAPRPYEELYAENVYLVSALHLQNAIRKQLTQQYSSVAEELSVFETAKQRRRLRKKLSQLRPKISAAAEQEKTVFLRLSELQIEMDSRETWAQAHDASLRQRALPSPGPTLSSFSTISDTSSSHSTCTTPLNATSPVFISKRELLELPISSESRFWAAELGPELGTVEEAGEEFFSNHDLKYRYRSIDSLEESRPVVWNGATVKPRLGRSPSLPSLQCMWPGE